VGPIGRGMDLSSLQNDDAESQKDGIINLHSFIHGNHEI